MGKVTICSFNVENLYLRYDFTPMPPGIRTEEIPEEDFVKGVGYLPANYLNKKDFTLYRDSARELTALALTGQRQFSGNLLPVRSGKHAGPEDF